MNVKIVLRLRDVVAASLTVECRLKPCLSRVKYKVAVDAVCRERDKFDEEGGSELESRRELNRQLPNAIAE